MFTSNVQFGHPCPRGGGASCPGWFILPLIQDLGQEVSPVFLLHHNLGMLSCKRYKHYFSQIEMFTSNFQFGWLVGCVEA